MEEIQIDQGTRLKALMKALNLTQTEFAVSLGMTQPNVNRMMSGRNKISMEVLNGLGKEYKHVNLHWLLTGYGEMFLDESLAIGVMTNKNAVAYNTKETLEEVQRLAGQLDITINDLLKTLKRK